MKQNFHVFFAIVLSLSMQACVAPPGSSHPELVEIMTDKQNLIDKIDKSIAQSNREIENGHWQQANFYLKSGLATLGDRYLNPGTIDDSGMKIIIADTFEKEGKHENAARLRLKILQERFSQFKINP